MSNRKPKQHWCAKIKDEVEKLAYQLNEEAERTERPIRRLSKVMYGSTCADMQVDVMGECLSSIKYVVGARRNRRPTAGEIARHTTQATGRPISRFTVARRLHGGGLFARRPVRCVPLTPAHRRRRSLWCREHRNWRDNEWERVLFTYESRFSLSSDSHRILIWRERGSRNHPSNIIERDRYGGRGVLVWGGIMLGSRTDRHIFNAGSVNGTRYCNEILLPYVRLFRGAMALQFLFMDDNAPCHSTVAAEQLLESRRFAARTLPPVTIRELRLALQDEWATMPQQLIDTLIVRMGRRCETCLAVSGEIISPTKDRMFLAGHPSQGCFSLQSHFALHATFSIKLLFIPLISLLKQSPLLTMDRSDTLYMSWKLCKKSSFEMEFKSLVTFRWMSEISSNLFSLKASLSHEKRKKFGGLRYGENGGCSICTPPFLPGTAWRY
ncbi:transposable element Tcb2 transposase [Trichonephila clavipes]|nr:transposable element Tcb2 transposase [Trichonephila clavipes]